MKKIYKTVCWLEESLCSIGFAAMIVLVFCSAIARGIGHPIAWSIDVAQLLLCWTTLIGADIAFRYGKFMGLDLLTKHFPVKFQRLLAIVLNCVILCILAIMALYGARLAVSNYSRSFQTLKISYSWVTISLPVMCVLMGISDITDIVSKIKNFNAPQEEKEVRQ